MKIILLVLMLFIPSFSALSQFTVDKYKEYLKDHTDMSYQQLLDEYPAGKFLSGAPTDFSRAAYSDSVRTFLNLTPYEEALINKNGFMVTDRNSPYSFLAAYYYIYDHDLPVYISAEAILHAMHYSFNRIYKNIEMGVFYPKLDTILNEMYEQTGYISKLSNDVIFGKAVNDFDVYFTVGRKLLLILDSSNYIQPVIEPYFDNNKVKVDSIITIINKFQPMEYNLFSSTVRLIDFSQFKPRGKYTESAKLKAYFKAMMWFGYVEIMINDAVQHELKYAQKEEDLRRQTLLAVLISKAAQKSNTLELINRLASYFKRLIGSPDNITINDFLDLFDKYNLNDVTVFAQKSWSEFLRYNVSLINSGKQLYNSQILFSDISNPEKIKPSTAFKLFGQVPVIDGFITSNVVYDNIIFEKMKSPRLLPSTQDILFALGNDASIQLLDEELTKYKYSSNLASLRYLIASYDTSFWGASVYNCWLNAIRSLNPPGERKNLPQFMQTAAWWQKTMNTQLASWSQLRHDFILNVKQPYTAGFLCSFPYGFVEPVPELYKKIGQLFALLADIEPYKNYYTPKICPGFINVASKLEAMANKELNREKFDKNDSIFINSMISTSGCVKTLDGWYVRLYDGYDYFQNSYDGFPFEKTVDITVADVHTAPTDIDGNLLGYVLHAGTSYPNYSVVVWKNPEGMSCSYTGAVFNYFEQVTKDFKRLTDEEWKESLNNGNPYHPKFCNLFLADKNGNSPKEFQSLLIEDPISVINEKTQKFDNFLSPNPVTDFLEISYSPSNKSGLGCVSVEVYNVLGECIKEIPLNPPFSKGEIKLDVSGLSPGVYFVKVGVQVSKFIKI